MFYSLHWLPIEQRIEYKLSLLSFKIISHEAPVYLSELLHLNIPSRQLRSSAGTHSEYHPSEQSRNCIVGCIFYDDIINKFDL